MSYEIEAKAFSKCGEITLFTAFSVAGSFRKQRSAVEGIWA